MTRFLIRRIILGLITLWVIVTLVFLLYYAGPHDPARQLAGRAATPALLAQINREYGFNLPVIVQYWDYLKRLVPFPGLFNLGTSNNNRLPVTTIIAQAVPIDISLAVGAAVLWMLLGISVGVLAARRPRSLWDRGATAFVLTGISMPTFILGLLLLYVFYYLLTIHGIAIFPKPGSWTPFTAEPARVGARPDPALDHARADHRGDVLAAHPKFAARESWRGLHQDSACERIE